MNLTKFIVLYAFERFQIEIHFRINIHKIFLKSTMSSKNLENLFDNRVYEQRIFIRKNYDKSLFYYRKLIE